LRYGSALICLCLTFCTSAEKDPHDLYNETLRMHRGGEKEHAAKLAQKGIRRQVQQEDVRWRWRFQMLAWRIAISQSRDLGSVECALLDASPYTERYPELEARRFMLLARLYDKLEDPDSVERTLAAARQYALRDADSPLAMGILAENAILNANWLLEETEEKVEALRQAIRQAEACGDHYLQTNARIVLGFVLLQKMRHDEAVDALAEAPGDQPGAAPRRAALNTNLGLCYSRLGFYERSERHLREALADLARYPHENTRQSALGELGSNSYFRGEFEKALNLYEQAHRIAHEVENRHHARLWARNAAAACIELERWEEAAIWNQEAWPRSESQEDLALAHLQLNAGFIALGRGDHAAAREAFQAALAIDPKDHTVSWEAHAGLAAVDMAAGDDVSVARHYETAIRQIDKSLGQIADQFEVTYFSRLIGFYQDYVAFLARNGDAWSAMQVAERSRARILAARFRDRSGLQMVGARQRYYQELAKESDAVLMAYWLAPEESYLWVFSPRGSGSFVLPADRDIVAMTEGYLEAILSRPRQFESEGRQLGFRLYQTLVAPAADLIPSGAKVYLVPDQELGSLNFEALPINDSGPVRFWIEEAHLTVLPALSLPAGRVREKPLALSSGLLIGDPLEATPAFPRLLYAGREIEAVAERLASPKMAMDILVGADATRNAFLRLSRQNPDVIHFAAHAQIKVEAPLESAIILSPLREGGAESYKLYAKDILDRSLEAEIVVVSTCRSAGAAYAGEGMVGFAWAFLYAGARRVIAGLWEVDDRAAAELMTLFYTNLEYFKEPSEALRQAKLTFLRSEGKNRAPFYWAPFQIYACAPSRRGQAKAPEPTAEPDPSGSLESILVPLSPERRRLQSD